MCSQLICIFFLDLKARHDLKDTVEVLIKYDHEYDQEVIEFFNTIEYLGGSTVNFLRGPMYHGQGRGGEKKAEDAAFNLAGP